jgi:hypothetical protein
MALEVMFAGFDQWLKKVSFHGASKNMAPLSPNVTIYRQVSRSIPRE